MWAAELAFMPDGDKTLRRAQFAIRTAVRAQALAKLAGTDPVDELLDARACARSVSSRKIYETAIAYLKREQELRHALRWYLQG